MSYCKDCKYFSNPYDNAQMDIKLKSIGAPKDLRLCLIRFERYNQGQWNSPYWEGGNPLVFLVNNSKVTAYQEACNYYESEQREKGGCFITSAVCKTLNKVDDCIELTVFRNFRDTFMQETAEMQADIKEYYDIAPKICAAIDCLGRELALKAYTQIWEYSLYPALIALETGDKQSAYDIYKNMVLDLKEHYLKD